MSAIRIIKLTDYLRPEIIPLLNQIAVDSRYPNCDLEKLSHLFVAYERGSPVAFAGIACYRGSWCLRVCVVAKRHRGLGIQRALIRDRIQFIQHKAKYLNAWVSPKNTYSLNNLIAEGFIFVKEPSKVFHGIECFKLRKKL